MVLEHMNQHNSQIENLSALEHMIASGDINGYLKAFLLSCKVDELSPVTIKDYEQKISAFIRYSATLGVTKPTNITIHSVRLFLLDLQQRCSPHSVHDYYGCIKRFLNWLVSEGVLEANPMSLG
jgi:site-specific recombinase XerC